MPDIDRDHVHKTATSLEGVREWLFSQKRLADAQTLRDAALTLSVLFDEREIYRHRCVAAAKQMDDMTLRLQALEARRKKANEP